MYLIIDRIIFYLMSSKSLSSPQGRERPLFSLWLHGWTSNHSLEHYVAMYALYMKDGVVCSPLLACSPMEAIASYGATAHRPRGRIF